jgi:uncharacterized membrane-anchored protein
MTRNFNESPSDASTKVPEVTLAFWIIKIAATALGETASDSVTMTFEWGYLTGTVMFLPGLVVLVIFQIVAKKFHPFLYWATIVASTIFSTTMADFADRSLGIGYAGGSALLLGLLLTNLAVWYWTLGSISLQSIATAKSEAFYWTGITLSQALGTSRGDWMAHSMGIDYDDRALIFAAGLAVLGGAYYWTNVSHALLFWAAFTLSRPLGATLGDFLGRPIHEGGLALSRPIASAAIAAFIIGCILLLPQRPAGSAPNITHANDAVRREPH